MYAQLCYVGKHKLIDWLSITIWVKKKTKQSSWVEHVVERGYIKFDAFEEKQKIIRVN